MDKILFVVADVDFLLFVGIGDDVFAHAVGGKTLLRGIDLVGLQRIDGPVLAEAESELGRRELREGVQIAHRLHLALVILGRVLHAVFGGDGQRDDKDVLVPFAGDDGVHRKKRLFIDHVVGKLGAPQPVAVDVFGGGEHFGGRGRRPFGVNAVPVVFVVGCGVANDRLVFAVEALDRLGRRKRARARADRGDDEHAVFVVLATYDVLRDIDRAEQRGSGRLGYAFAVVKIARGKPPDDVADVFERGVIFRFTAVCGRGQADAVRFARRRIVYARYPLVAEKLKIRKDARNDQQNCRKQDEYASPCKLFQKCSHIRSLFDCHIFL